MHSSLLLSQITKYLTVQILAGVETIVLGPCIDRHLGLALRVSEVTARMSHLSKRLKLRWNQEALEATVCDGTTHLDTACLEIAQSLSNIAVRPLTPKMLLKALPISTRERLRWTKDGRLKTSGRLLIRQGAVAYTVPTYSISAVEDLLQHIELLDRWRQDDGIQSAAIKS